jgi:hypothetical protein
MRIRQRATACVSRWFDLARSETWTKDCPRHVRDQQETQQELAVGAARWACRTWVVVVMDIQDYKIIGADQGLPLNPLRSWGIMGEKLLTTW